MDSNIVSIIAIIISLVVGIGLIVMYKKRIVDGELIEGTASVMNALDLSGDSPFERILGYARTAVLTVEQLVKTGVINKDDESRKTAAMDIVETAALVDGLEYKAAEEELASACIEAEVSKLPRNHPEET